MGHFPSEKDQKARLGMLARIAAAPEWISPESRHERRPAIAFERVREAFALMDALVDQGAMDLDQAESVRAELRAILDSPLRPVP